MINADKVSKRQQHNLPKAIRKEQALKDKQVKLELHELEKEIKYAARNGKEYAIISQSYLKENFPGIITQDAREALEDKGYYVLYEDPSNSFGWAATYIYFNKTAYEKELKRIQETEEADRKSREEYERRMLESKKEQNKLWEQRQKEINRTITYKHYKNICDFLKSLQETGITVKSEIFDSLSELKEIALAREEHTAYVFSDDYE